MRPLIGSLFLLSAGFMLEAQDRAWKSEWSALLEPQPVDRFSAFHAGSAGGK
jgi:hypothetical protein